MLGMKHCAPAIRDSGGGSIINISSVAGLTAHDDAAYTASKWGLRGLTKTAVLRFSKWNIRVNSIHPGQIADAGFYRNAGEAFAQAARTAIPMHRQGTPKECADLVLFLASDESSFISGAEIAIDGAISPPVSPVCAKISPPVATNSGAVRCRSALQTCRKPSCS
jgi:3alpha(or 20beta)-hydroxysteroid dehydrogenase